MPHAQSLITARHRHRPCRRDLGRLSIQGPARWRPRRRRTGLGGVYRELPEDLRLPRGGGGAALYCEAIPTGGYDAVPWILSKGLAAAVG